MIDIAIRSDGKGKKRVFRKAEKRKREKTNQINNLGVVFLGGRRESVTFGERFKDKYLTKYRWDIF